jgi:replicative superfamily II helicase
MAILIEVGIFYIHNVAFELMDDILYIILGIAWLAYSFYANKQKMDKKKSNQAKALREQQARREYQPEQSEQVPRKSVLEELFGEISSEYTEAQEEIYIPEVDEDTTKRKLAEYAHNEAESLELIKEEVPFDYFLKKYESGYKTVNENFHDALKIEEEDKEIEELTEKFNLSKAVIYSEILRAPYNSWQC